VDGKDFYFSAKECSISRNARQTFHLRPSDGFALGGGCELALSARFGALASKTANARAARSEARHHSRLRRIATARGLCGKGVRGTNFASPAK